MRSLRATLPALLLGWRVAADFGGLISAALFSPTALRAADEARADRVLQQQASWKCPQGHPGARATPGPADRAAGRTGRAADIEPDWSHGRQLDRPAQVLQRLVERWPTPIRGRKNWSNSARVRAGASSCRSSNFLADDKTPALVAHTICGCCTADGWCKKS